LAGDPAGYEIDRPPTLSKSGTTTVTIEDTVFDIKRRIQSPNDPVGGIAVEIVVRNSLSVGRRLQDGCTGASSNSSKTTWRELDALAEPKGSAPGRDLTNTEIEIFQRSGTSTN
jgi:hypothetical protein